MAIIDKQLKKYEKPELKVHGDLKTVTASAGGEGLNDAIYSGTP
ncbi:MAG: lasso RiPP family leader peptide-containing protein [Methanobacterium paludis]|nr:lasso RiPP family leader peptide-containing protein [Methanobacterium paludis]